MELMIQKIYLKQRIEHQLKKKKKNLRQRNNYHLRYKQRIMHSE